MAARAGGPPGGAQVITTFNGGNVVSTQVPSLNFDGQNAGDLIKTITGVQPNMVSGVTLDNTFIGHQQYRYLPYPVNNRTITFQYTTPNWCHVRDMALNLQCLFRCGGPGAMTQHKQEPMNFTQKKIYAGGYHITNGGILAMFNNMRIKLGAQVDIFTAFEKTKCAYHILNTWLRGTWDQFTVFSLIDRWDAWYPTGYMETVNPNYETVSNPTAVIYGMYWNNMCDNNHVTMPQSPHNFERRLSKTLADRGLMREWMGAGVTYTTGKFIEIIENVSFPFHVLHSLFQQNILLPPGLQFIIEIDLPMYVGYNPSAKQAEFNPTTAVWQCIGFVQNSYGEYNWGDNSTLDDTQYQLASYYVNSPGILVSVNNNSTFNSITMNCVNMKPEVARSLQDERIKRPLVYNYSQMIATTVGSYFEGQSVYNFTLPPNQAIPTQFIFGWVNPQMYVGPPNINKFPGQPVADNYVTCNFSAFMNGFNNANTIGASLIPTGWSWDGPNIMDSSVYRQFIGTSFTPLPVSYKRMIVRRGGFQEIYQYGTYYDGLGSNSNAFLYNTVIGASDNESWMPNCIKLLGAKNITPDSTQKYFDHLEEYQWDRKSTNGLGPLERRLKYSYTQAYLSEGKWCAFQVNPCKNDLGQYSSDQNAYSVDVQLEMDWDLPLSVNWSGLNPNSKLVCIRVMPAQLSYAIDGTVRIYTWPNLLISPNAVVSGNPPPAGPGGSI